MALCFRYMIFCSSDCMNTACRRNWTADKREASVKWWEGCEGKAPVAFSDFSDTCEDYEPPVARCSRCDDEMPVTYLTDPWPGTGERFCPNCIDSEGWS